MKKYDTPYGKKNGLLLALSMDAFTREDENVTIMTNMIETLEKYAPQDANHEGLETCNLLAKARNWLEKRKKTIEATENNFSS